MRPIHCRLFLVVLFVLSALLVEDTYAQTSSASVNATVKLSICGNGIVEKGEDCEGSDLQNNSCVSRGYINGKLSCDISCSFDTFACSSATQVPTPTTGFTSTQSSVNPTSIPTVEPTETQVNTFTPEQSFLAPQAENTPSFPATLRSFDFNGDAKIEKTELQEVVSLWVDGWKQFIEQGSRADSDQVCDINQDQTCELDDLSILLFYVEK